MGMVNLFEGDMSPQEEVCGKSRWTPCLRLRILMRAKSLIYFMILMT